MRKTALFIIGLRKFTVLRAKADSQLDKSYERDEDSNISNANSSGENKWMP